MQFYKDKPMQMPMRKCLVTGSSIDKKNLIKFVIGPENQLIADIDQNLPGRGYWVKADRQTIIIALKKNYFFTAVKKKITIHSDLLSVIEEQIKKRIIQQISISRKAGQTVFGFEKVKSALLKKSINLLIQAKDGSNKEKQRILTKTKLKIIDNCLTSAELGKALGRDKVIHCGILGNGFVEKIIFNANRLNNLKNPVPHYSNIEKSNKY